MPTSTPGTDLGSWGGVPATDGRAVFIQTDTGVMALVPQDGRILWATRLNRPRSPASERIVYREGVVVITDRDSTFGLDAATGVIRWRASYGADTLHQLALLGATDGEVYVVQRYAPLVTAANLHTGAVIWSREVIPDSGYSSIVTGMAWSGDTVYLGGARNRSVTGYPKRRVLVAVSRASGVPLLQIEGQEFESGSAFDLSLRDSLLLTSDFRGKVLAFNRFTGASVWQFTGDTGYIGPDYSPILAGDTAFVGSNDRFVYALDARSGALLWKARPGSSIHSFALCGRYVLANDMRVVAVDRATRRSAPRPFVNAEGDSRLITTSGFAVVGTTAVVAGTHYAFGVDCG